MEPLDFCEYWLDKDRYDPGFRSEGIRLLEQSLFGLYSFDSINNNWGKDFVQRPERVLVLIQLAHEIRLIESETLEAKEKIDQILERLDRLKNLSNPLD